LSMFADEVAALVMLAGLSVGGVVIGLGLLVPQRLVATATCGALRIEASR
jgi:hypothetical protein